MIDICPVPIIKRCARCSETKPTAQFNRSASTKDGRFPYCKKCKSSDDRKRHSADYVSVEHRARVLHRNALKRGIPGSTLSLRHVLNGVTAGRCPVTNIAFDLSYSHREIAGRFKCPYAPSLDRVDTNKPYTDENVRVVVWWYNMAKGELTDPEVFHLCRLIAGRFPA